LNFPQFRLLLGDIPGGFSSKQGLEISALDMHEFQVNQRLRAAANSSCF